MKLDIFSSKILIVDDIMANIKLLQKTLGDGFSYDYALDGETALEKIDVFSPDLILLDVMMPGIDGYEVCRQLKETKSEKDIPVIFITSKDDEAFESLGFEVGGVDYITKPLKKSVVLARVKCQLTLKKQRDILENLSNLDGLTGIPNRRSFDTALEKIWRRARRTRERLSMLMIDIDYFKKFNDSLGHLEGDDCLQQVAKALYASIRRPYDFVGRYGGEEFVVLLPETDETGAKKMARKMSLAVEKLKITHPDSDASAHVSISIGIASVSAEELENSLHLVEIADKALYQAKEKGRNTIVSLSR